MTKIEKLKQELKEFFERHPYVHKIYGGGIGTYHKYELRGDTWEDKNAEPYPYDKVSFDKEWEVLVENEYKELEWVDKNIYEKFETEDEDKIIDIIVKDCPYIDPWLFTDSYPRRGGLIAYAEIHKGKITIGVDDYDPE